MVSRSTPLTGSIRIFRSAAITGSLDVIRGAGVGLTTPFAVASPFMVAAAAGNFLGAILVALERALPPAALVGLTLVIHEIARSLVSIVGSACAGVLSD